MVTNDLAIALALEGVESVRALFMGSLVRRNCYCTRGRAWPGAA